MCWSKHEREQWEERRAAEDEAERIRMISRTEPTETPEPAQEDEREPELVRG